MLIRLAAARPPPTATFMGPATSAALHLFWVMPVFSVSSGMDSKPITKA